jgi:hypothetical protein
MKNHQIQAVEPGIAVLFIRLPQSAGSKSNGCSNRAGINRLLAIL